MNRNTARILFLFVLLWAITSLACFGSASGSRNANRDAAPAADSVGAIQVTAREFQFTLDASSAAAGSVTFVITNNGQMPHDFAISGPGVDAKTPLLQPGESAELTVTLQPGSYTYACTVPGHSLLGMTGTLTVSP